MPSAVLQDLETFGPQHCEQLDYAQAAAYTRRLAASQYENFTVVSFFLPRHLREDFRHVYAFCRWADDLGDETADPANPADTSRGLELLAWWRRELDACYDDRPRHPVFVALHRTIQRHDIPRKPFDDLIDAFVQDQTVRRYTSWEQVLDYCTRSADPVGRLVLYLCGYRDAQRQQLSDATCTALQFANFWQDVRRDVLERDRIYMPRDVASKHGLDLDAMASAIRADAAAKQAGAVRCRACPPSIGMSALTPPFRNTLRELVERTWPLFERGRELWPLLEPAVRNDIRLFTLGGESILRMIERQHYNTLEHRPSLSKAAKLTLMLRVLARKLVPGRRARREGAAA